MLGNGHFASAVFGVVLSTAFLCACGGNSSSGTVAPGGPSLNPPGAPLVRVSTASPYVAGCGTAGAPRGDVSYQEAEVEPYLAVNPTNPSNLIGIWQQDRWADAGAHGLAAAYSMDGGKTWTEKTLTMSVCAGGTSGNGGGYARASDPWVTFSPDGVAYVISISFNSLALVPGSISSVLVSRSTDGGATWSNPATLILDGDTRFDDKESITADPNNSNFVYAVWDRLSQDSGPAFFSRTTDGGVSWEAARAIYDPGTNSQTIGNEIAVLQDGTVMDVFEEIDNFNAQASASLRVVSSIDHGATWSQPVTVAADLAIGARDPETGQPVRDGAGLPQMTAGPGNKLVLVWQDARFSNGQRDGVAMSISGDDGLSWSAPVQVNSVASVPAFTPSVAVRADGTIGVSYFDFRNDSADPGTLPTDYWFTSSIDGMHWSEQHITGPFDLDLAPDAGGLFLGDYQSIAVIGQTFVPFFVQTNDEGTADRTDDYALPPQLSPLTPTNRITHVSAAVHPISAGAGFRQKVHANLLRVMSAERPGWMPKRGTQPP